MGTQRLPAAKALRQFLSQCRVFQGLNDIEIATLAGLALVESYDDGELILQEGSTGDSFYVIFNGSVEISKKEKGGGQNIVLEVLRSRDLFGEMALVQKRPRTATATTAEDSTILRYAFQDFDKLQQHFPDTAKKILDNMRQVIANRAWAMY